MDKIRKLIALADKFESSVAEKGEYGGKGSFELPKSHKALVPVTKGGSSCSNCKWVDAEKHECGNKYYIQWNGDNRKLPDEPLDEMCSDWWEPAAAKKTAQSQNNSILDKMRGLADGAVIAVKHLLSINKYKNSQGLKILQSQLPILVSVLQKPSLSNGDIHSVGELLGNMSFYTSRGNTGHGFDPITEVRENGYTAPSYYIIYLGKLYNGLQKTKLPDKKYDGEFIA